MKWLVLFATGCGFAPQVAETGTTDDAAPHDTGHVIDARPIDAPADARVCPPAPANCVAFTCASTSSCYYSCATHHDWNGSQTACAAMPGACLATMHDQAEQTCIALATLPSFPDIVWFGWVQAANGAEPAGGWGWKCGTSTYTAPNWGGTEPNNQGGNEDCGAMTNGGAWIDGDCGTNARYVCELP